TGIARNGAGGCFQHWLSGFSGRSSTHWNGCGNFQSAHIIFDHRHHWLDRDHDRGPSKQKTGLRIEPYSPNSCTENSLEIKFSVHLKASKKSNDSRTPKTRPP